MKKLSLHSAFIFILSAALFSSVSHSLSPETAVQLLYGEGQEQHHDSEGYTYRVFRVQDSSDLKDLIDSISARLLQTNIGNSLCREVLDHRWQALVHHLAMTPLAAQKAAAICARDDQSSSVVYDDPRQSPRKLTLNGENSPRRYIIVVTDQPNLLFDSWTDAYTNQTTLFLHNSKKQSDLNLRHLTQMIAHEMAIYFDSKSWPMGPGWDNIPELRATQLRANQAPMVSSAALNPAISTVLAFIRAYKVERNMVRELLGKGLLGSDPLFYPAKDYPFLRLSCRADCIATYIREQQGWLNSIQHALLAFSPHYRARRLELLRSYPFGLSNNDSVIDALERFPVTFLSLLKTDLVALNLVTSPGTPEEILMRKVINQTMNDFLIPADLKALFEARIWVPRDGTEYDLLTYLTLPLLSDSNTILSAGPRPRIRTGGTQ